MLKSWHEAATERQPVSDLRSLSSFLLLLAIAATALAVCIDLKAPTWVDVLLGALTFLLFSIVLIVYSDMRRTTK